MRRRRLAAVGVLGVALAASPIAFAPVARAKPLHGPVHDAKSVVIVTTSGGSFREATVDPQLRSLGARGGIALLRGSEDVATVLPRIQGSMIQRVGVPARSAVNPVQVLRSSLARFEAEGRLPPGGGQVTVAIVIQAPAADLPDTIVLATGSPSELLSGGAGSVGTLTSDSTRRVGIVTPDDLAATVADAIDDPSIDVGDGSPIEVVAQPPPVDLYERYIDYRELTTPVQTMVGIWEVGLAAWALWAIRSSRTQRAVLVAVLSLPGLFLALLLVGHLPHLTYATVLPVLVGVSLAGGLAFVRVADRAGIGVALAWAGGLALGGLVLESLLGWTAAFAPMLGGSELDGARFYGMPNAEIGLAVGGGLLVAHRLRSTAAGVALLGATALWAGSPWFGANLGAAVTASAAAGLWWGLRGHRGAAPTVVGTLVSTAVGTAATVGLHRLDARPTHITRVTTGLDPTAWLDDLWRRLGIGVRLIADQPAAAIPVIGTVVGLAAIVRSPAPLADGFRQAPVTREAALAIALSSLVALVANDTGAAALGLGFGLLAVTVFSVSLAAGAEKMDT